MATVTITITDDPGSVGQVDVKMNFHGGFDNDSAAHTLAGEIALDLKEGQKDDAPR